MNKAIRHSAVIVGGGPGGLMAAQNLAAKGFEVHLYERNPWVGRKFLVAGKSGLNLTNNKPLTEFLDRYGLYLPDLRSSLNELQPSDVRAWAHELGINTFVGSSGKIFPEGMKAAPLLAAWKQRLDQLGVHFHFQHTFTNIDPDKRLVQFSSPDGLVSVESKVIFFALGGGSWRVTGSTGDWVPLFEKWGITCSPLKPSNMGFDIQWSEHLLEKFEGAPIKTVSVNFQDSKGVPRTRVGEFVISRYGIEGNLIYALSAAMRDTIELLGPLTIHINLLPNSSVGEINNKLKRWNHKRSTSTNLSRILSLPKEKIALLWEARQDLNQISTFELGALITSCPVTLLSPRPLDEAISSAGGIRMDQLNEFFMVKKYPGLFFAGEMLDWEAPTGGYLLNGVMATGSRAASGMARMLADQP